MQLAVMSAELDGVIEGIVFGEDGRPTPDLPVVLLGAGPQPLRGGKTDAEGRFRFEKLRADTFRVRAGGNEHGLATGSVVVGKGASQATLHLRREACVRGRLLDHGGQPLAGATVEWHADGGGWADRTEADASGRFVLANLPSVPGRLVVFPGKARRRFPVAVEANVVPDTGDVLLTAGSGGSVLQLLPRVPEGLDVDDARIRVRQLETGYSLGISTAMVETTTNADGEVDSVSLVQDAKHSLRLRNLPVGDYEVSISLPGSGWHAAGRHFVDGSSPCDLGAFGLRSPGRLRFTLPDTPRPDDFQIEIAELRDDLDVRIETLVDLDRELLLAPGDYVLAMRRGEQPVRFARFSITSGQATALPITW